MMHKNLGSLNLLVLLPEQKFFFLANAIILWLNEFQVLNSWILLHQIKLEFLAFFSGLFEFLISSFGSKKYLDWSSSTNLSDSHGRCYLFIHRSILLKCSLLFSVKYLKILYTFSMLDRIAVGYSPANYSTWKYLIFRIQAIYIQSVIYIAKER